MSVTLLASIVSMFIFFAPVKPDAVGCGCDCCVSCDTCAPGCCDAGCSAACCSEKLAVGSSRAVCDQQGGECCEVNCQACCEDNCSSCCGGICGLASAN